MLLLLITAFSHTAFYFSLVATLTNELQFQGRKMHASNIINEITTRLSQAVQYYAVFNTMNLCYHDVFNYNNNVVNYFHHGLQRVKALVLYIVEN